MTITTQTISINQDIEVEIDLSEFIHKNIKDIIKLINKDESVYITIKKVIDEKTEEYKLINGNLLSI